MKVTDLQDRFRISMNQFEESRLEAFEVIDMYHNRHYTSSQLSKLRSRGQPAETFNVVKMYTRMLTGYFSTVVNSIWVKAIGHEDTALAAIGQDVVNHTLRHNNYNRLKTKLQKDLILTMLFPSRK